jgi:hypothetical protein
MSCWVVPTIAAELWGVPLQQVLDGMKAGHIPFKDELGRSFVDVAPDSPKLQTPAAMRQPTPPTFTVVTSEELVALTDDETEDQPTMDLGDWREARDNAEKRRRPPVAIAA